MKQKYLKDPKCFWNDRSLCSVLSPKLIDFANYVFSIRSGAVKCKSGFSHMTWMISSRRSSITGPNADKRLTLTDLLPQKRRLESEMQRRGIKRQKLFHRS